MSYEVNIKPFPRELPELRAINRSVVREVFATDFTGFLHKELSITVVRRGWLDVRWKGAGWRRIRGGELLACPPKRSVEYASAPTSRVQAYDVFVSFDSDKPFLGSPLHEPLRQTLKRITRVVHAPAPKSMAQNLSALFALCRARRTELTPGRAQAHLAAALLAFVDGVGVISSKGQRRPNGAPAHVMPDYLQQADRYLMEHLPDPISLEVLQRYTGYARSTLIDAFLRHLGVTPMERLTQLRIDRAARMLTETRLSITHIAGAVGFASSQHFATVFRKHMLLSPTAYRAASDTSNRNRGK